MNSFDKLGCAWMSHRVAWPSLDKASLVSRGEPDWLSLASKEKSWKHRQSEHRRGIQTRRDNVVSSI